MKSIVLHAWTLNKVHNEYFIPYTHWIYLNEIVKYYDRVCLLSPVNYSNDSAEKSLESISCFKNIEVYELPYSDGYIDAVKNFFHYKRAYKNLSQEFDSVYARYPIPFGWLQNKYFINRRKIIHFVGDPVDTINNNPKLSFIKKQLYTKLFLPEHYMFMKACKTAEVYTNGFHLSERLEKFNIKSTPLISSTLNEEDFFFGETKIIDIDKPKILYVGYLRKAKGVETVINSFFLLQKKYSQASLTIVGSGESENELKSIISSKGIKNVVFSGHIDKRAQLNKMFRTHDIFTFASLSEGSPRVILEAVANGINVVSTPVGALPYIFTDDVEIKYADFHNEEMFRDKMIELISDKSKSFNIRKLAYDKAKQYTIEKFLKTIFYEG